MLYLVDSDWAISFLNGNPGTVGRLEALRPEGIGISIISVAEIYEGMYGHANSCRQEQPLQRFMSMVQTLYVNEAICRIFAQERRRLRSLGALIGDFDLLIAATAIHNGLTLLTNNRRHFERVQDLSIIPA